MTPWELPQLQQYSSTVVLRLYARTIGGDMGDGGGTPERVEVVFRFTVPSDRMLDPDLLDSESKSCCFSRNWFAKKPAPENVFERAGTSPSRFALSAPPPPRPSNAPARDATACVDGWEIAIDIATCCILTLPYAPAVDLFCSY